MKSEKNRPRRIRRRTDNAGSISHPRKVTIRLTERQSNELASIQGLLWRYGAKKNLSAVFADVLLPRLREYVRPLATKAMANRKAARR